MKKKPARPPLSSPSPLAGIVARIKRDPLLGERLAAEAGIVTRTGRLTKSYRR